MGIDVVTLKRNSKGDFDIRGYLDGVVGGKDLIGSQILSDIYFAAVNKDWGDGFESTQCVVVYLTKLGDENDKDNEFTLGFKEIPEIMGPAVRFCPKEIFDLLSPLSGERYKYALEWRRACEEFFNLSSSKQREITSGKSVKSFRIDTQVADDFKEVCKIINMTQSDVLEYLMSQFCMGNLPEESSDK